LDSGIGEDEVIPETVVEQREDVFPKMPKAGDVVEAIEAMEDQDGSYFCQPGDRFGVRDAINETVHLLLIDSVAIFDEEDRVRVRRGGQRRGMRVTLEYVRYNMRIVMEKEAEGGL